MREQITGGAHTNCLSESFGENLSLFHLHAIDLGTDHRAEGDFGTELLRDGESQGGFPGPRSTDKEKGMTREFMQLDKVNNDAAGLGGDPDGSRKRKSEWGMEMGSRRGKEGVVVIFVFFLVC